MKWKQLLKNYFVLLVRFNNSRKQPWRRVLEIAASKAVTELCPNWKSDKKERETYDLIQKETQRKGCPRQGWLHEKAYAWLNWLSHELQKPSWYPDYAILVAHHIFLDGMGGQFKSFMNYVKKTKLPGISHMIRAHESTIGSPLGLC